MKLSEIITEDLVQVPLENTEKEKIIQELLNLLHRANKISDFQKVLNAVIDREKVMTTGIGNGVAIPHGKSDGAAQISAAFGITGSDVDFGSIDEKPVRLVFILVGPESTPGPHIKILSRISRLMSKDQFRQKLLQCQSAKEVIDCIREEEEKYFEM